MRRAIISALPGGAWASSCAFSLPGLPPSPSDWRDHDPNERRTQVANVRTPKVADVSVGRSLTALAISLLIAYTCAGIGAVASVRAPEFYAALDKPRWAPPSSAFGPVWTILYG